MCFLTFCNVLQSFVIFFVIFGGPTNRQTDRQTDLLGIKAPSWSLKSDHPSEDWNEGAMQSVVETC